MGGDAALDGGDRSELHELKVDQVLNIADLRRLVVRHLPRAILDDVAAFGAECLITGQVEPAHVSG